MPLKIALVGTGAMATKHATTLSEHSGAELVALCSTQRSRSVGEEFVERYGFARLTQDFDSLIQDPEIEAIFICSPDATHPTYTAAALDAGKHVFCEKPVARNHKGFGIVEQAHRRNSGILQVGMNCRYREQYSLPKQLSDRGELGSLRFVRGIYLLNKLGVAKRGEKAWWREHPEDVHFFLHANGIHIIDLVRWYGGEVRSVFARATGFELAKDFKADTFSISLEFTSGAIGEILVSSVAFQPTDVSLQLWFENGSILKTSIYRRDGEELASDSQELEVKQEVLDLGLQFEALLEAISTGTPPMNNFEEALENFHLMNAIERSLQSGQPVVPNWSSLSR